VALKKVAYAKIKPCYRALLLIKHKFSTVYPT
jgi:hypothetical protein